MGESLHAPVHRLKLERTRGTREKGGAHLPWGRRLRESRRRSKCGAFSPLNIDEIDAIICELSKVLCAPPGRQKSARGTQSRKKTSTRLT